MQLTDLVVGTAIHCDDTGFGEKDGRIVDIAGGDFTIVWDRTTPGVRGEESPDWVGRPLTYLRGDVSRMLARPTVQFTPPGSQP